MCGCRSFQGTHQCAAANKVGGSAGKGLQACRSPVCRLFVIRSAYWVFINIVVKTVHTLTMRTDRLDGRETVQECPKICEWKTVRPVRTQRFVSHRVSKKYDQNTTLANISVWYFLLRYRQCIRMRSAGYCSSNCNNMCKGRANTLAASRCQSVPFVSRAVRPGSVYFTLIIWPCDTVGCRTSG